MAKTTAVKVSGEASAKGAPSLAVDIRVAPPSRLSRRGVAILTGVILVLNFPVIHRFLIAGPPDATVSIPPAYKDDFSNPRSIDANTWTPGGSWRTVNGEVVAPGVRGNRLWLNADLPDDVVVELDSRGDHPEAALTVELFGDGWTSNASKATGYLFTIDGKGGAAICSRPVEGRRGPDVFGQTPDTLALRERRHWRIERISGRVRWTVDGRVVCDFQDPQPLRGKGNNRLGFTTDSWNAYVDNLAIHPAGEAPAPTQPAPAPPPPIGPLVSVPLTPERWSATAPSRVTFSDREIVVREARNHPVWYREELPLTGSVELTIWTGAREGDMKFEAWGDGKTHAPTFEPAPYTASGYVFILGGWNNSKSIIAYRDEHGAHVVERSDFRVVPGRRYVVRVTRANGEVTMSVDDEPFLAMREPPEAVTSPGRFLGLSGWRTEVHFSEPRVSSPE